MKGKLRYIDEIECQALAGVSADVSLQGAFEHSFKDMKWVILADEEPIVAFGCSQCKPTPNLGVVWMLATDRYYEAKYELKSLGEIYLKIMFIEFDELANFVMVKNTKSVKWLERLGFTIEPPEHWGRSQELFRYFHMREEGLEKCVSL
jgi:hypothetical protein